MCSIKFMHIETSKHLVYQFTNSLVYKYTNSRKSIFSDFCIYFDKILIKISIFAQLENRSII